MSRFVGLVVCQCVAHLGLLVLALPPAFAAGVVEMQVEHILVQTIDEYNQAMEANDPAGWMRYFTDNVRRHSAVSENPVTSPTLRSQKFCRCSAPSARGAFAQGLSGTRPNTSTRPAPVAT